MTLTQQDVVDPTKYQNKIKKTNSKNKTIKNKTKIGSNNKHTRRRSECTSLISHGILFWYQVYPDGKVVDILQ